MVLAYYATGAPAARHELHRRTAEAVIRVNGGPVKLGQRLRSGVSSVLGSAVSVNPFRPSVDYAAWAHGVAKEAATTEDEQARALVRTLLARTTSDHEGTDERLIGRERYLIEKVVDPTALEEAESLPALRDAFKAQERARRRELLRHHTRYVDKGIFGPLAVRVLDHIGRGTAAGLLCGVVVTRGAEMNELVATIGTTSLIGGALGATVFVGHLLGLLPSLPATDGSVRMRIDGIRLARPVAVAAVMVLLVAVAVRLVEAAAAYMVSP